MARRSHARSRAPWVLLLTVAVAVALAVAGCTSSEPDAGPPTQPPSPSGSAPTAAPTPSPTASAVTPTESPLPSAPVYPSVEELDRQMARRGLHRVPPSTWNAATFRVASFNVLGASHTRGRDRRKGYAPAVARLPRAVRVLERAGVTVAGLQEFQSPQVRKFRELTGEGYGVYPGLTLGSQPAENSIVWRTAVWTVVRTGTTSVPYFFGQQRPMPRVLLRNKESGRLVWFANFHNPANTFGDANRWRDAATAVEVDLARRLGRGGIPVVFTGDMNDKAGYACPFTERTGMRSADGAATRDGRCVLPTHVGIDWIFGSSAVRFSDFTSDLRPKHVRITDHPLVTATANLVGVEQRGDCRGRLSSSGAVWYCRTP